MVSRWPVTVIDGCAHALARAHHEDIRINYEVLMRVSNSYDDNRQKMAELKHTYGDSIAKYQHRSRIAQLSDDDVELLYRSANVVAFYTEKAEYVGDMKKDLDALHERGLAADRHYRDLYEAYVSVRLFDKAEKLLKCQDSPDCASS